jgi:hypothetical protein
MHLKVIGCPIILREICACVARSQHIIDLEFFEIGLHIEPDKMRLDLQARIDASNGHGYDAVVLGATLCGNGCQGLVAGDAPLILPRAHDCITLILGSRARYEAQHSANPATYYYTPAWIERFGLEHEKATPYSLEARQAIYRQYVEQYGEENAAYLMDMLHSWQKNYTRACFVSTGLADEQLQAYREQAQHIAESYGWEYEEIPGEMGLIERLVQGDWCSEDFLVVPPGARIEASWDGGVVTASRSADR